jgi:hypothetical protein
MGFSQRLNTSGSLSHCNSQSGSELLYDWRFTANQFVLVPSPLRLTTRIFIFQLNTCGYSPYVTSSLTRRWLCRLQLLLVFASIVILRSESRGTQTTFYCLRFENPPTRRVSNRVARLYPRELGSLFVASYDSQGYGGSIRPRLHRGCPLTATVNWSSL